MSEETGPKVISQDEVRSMMFAGIADDINELENDLLPQLGHSQTKRLFIAVTKYPAEEVTFSDSESALRQAYTISKRLKDTLVAAATDVVIEGLIQKQIDQNGGSNV